MIPISRAIAYSLPKGKENQNYKELYIIAARVLQIEHLFLPTSSDWGGIKNIHCANMSGVDVCAGKYTVIHWNENGLSPFSPQSFEMLCKCYPGFVSAVQHLEVILETGENYSVIHSPFRNVQPPFCCSSAPLSSNFWSLCQQFSRLCLKMIKCEWVVNLSGV